MSSKLCRVHIKVDPELAELLNEQLMLSGGTKSRLLRRWIEMIDLGKLRYFGWNPENHNLISLNLRLSPFLYQKICRGAQRLMLSQHELVRLVILNAIFNPYALVPGHKQPQTLREQKLRDVKKYIDQASYHQAIELMDEMEYDLIARPNVDTEVLELNILRAKLFRHQRRLQAARTNLGRCLELANKSLQKHQIRECLSQLAVLDEIQDNMDSALRLAQESLEYDEDSRAQARILNLYALQQDINQVDKIIIDSHVHYQTDRKTQLLHEQRVAMAEIRIGRLESAKQRLKNAEQGLDPDMQTELRYNLENQAVILLAAGDKHAAHQKFTKAERIEMKTKTSADFSKAKLFRLFIESQDNFATSFGQMRQMVELQSQPVYVGLGKYVAYTAAYLTNTSRIHNRLGLKRLKELSQQAPNKMLQNAANYTLKHNQLLPVI